jgi:hypothetical protein
MQMAMNSLRTRMAAPRWKSSEELKMLDKVMRGKQESSWKTPAGGRRGPQPRNPVPDALEKICLIGGSGYGNHDLPADPSS